MLEVVPVSDANDDAEPPPSSDLGDVDLDPLMSPPHPVQATGILNQFLLPWSHLGIAVVLDTEMHLRFMTS